MSQPSSIKRAVLIIGCFVLGVLVTGGIVALLHRVDPTSLSFGSAWLLMLLGGVASVAIGHTRYHVKHVRTALKNHQMHTRDFYRTTPALLLSIDAHGRVFAVSQAWLDRLGYPREAVLGQDFFDFVAGRDARQLKEEYLQNLADQGEIRNTPYQLRRDNGSLIDVSLSAVAQTDASGHLKGSFAVVYVQADHPAATERIQRLAYFDPLTGLPNRALLNDRLHQAIALGSRENRQFGVYFFDLDHFKWINDTYGHAVGDQLLCAVAQRLKAFIRAEDTFARLAGDEFVIVQADPTQDPNFTVMGRRILEALRQPWHIEDREFFTTASLGLAIYPRDGEDPQTLLKNADTAMYEAKSRGRNNLRFYSEAMNAAARIKSNLESRLLDALSRGELQQHYQPLFNLATGRMTGVEALLRCSDNLGQPIPPEQIIAVAEESGLAFPLGEWVLKTACGQLKTWQDQGLQPLRMAVNLSGHHIRQSGFIDRVETIVQTSGIQPNTLEIELSENCIMSQGNDSIMVLTDLKMRGINLAIDHFGSGFSSLLNLKHFPIQRIKISREFIRDMMHNPDYAAVTEAILLMAGSLDLDVTAVGVEQLCQLNFLRKRSCGEVQGQLFATAMTAENMTAFLRQPEDRRQRFAGPNNPQQQSFPGSKEIH